MLTHTVFFWLNEGISAADRQTFLEGLSSLRAIPGSSRFLIGQPAATPKREVIDDSYDFALELDFASLPAQDVYQEHPLHLAFLTNCKQFWRTVRVYDFQWL
jgi:Stress responsive A/B Barrel Domain